VHPQLPPRSGAVAQVHIDPSLIRHAGFLSQFLEVAHRLFIQANRDLALQAPGGSAALAAGRTRDTSPGAVRGVSLSPNPLNPTATLKFAASAAGSIRVRLYDIQGRLVRTLLDERQAEPGMRSVRIDGRDDHGASLASGVYFYRIELGEKSVSGRFAICK
jgi:flagellar hook capping protein FlgD